MRATRFNHLSISAGNLEESVRFYEEMFGLERIPTYNFGFKTQYLRCGPQQLHIFELEDKVPVRQHFARDVDDFEAVYRAACSSTRRSTTACTSCPMAPSRWTCATPPITWSRSTGRT